jgi:mRNA-degrading endonuclease toxin of MazEF toxin-antitoxin module
MWPFQVEISPVGRIAGCALVDQIRAIDPLARFCKLAGRISDESLREVRTRLAALFSTMARN